MVNQSDWKWFGSCGHLIVGSDCIFHISTEVGDYFVSTVGEWFPSSERTSNGFGEMKEIGCGRKYETMVFKKSGFCKCGCGIPNIGEYIDSESYNDAKSANEGHLEMCKKWSKE